MRLRSAFPIEFWSLIRRVVELNSGRYCRTSIRLFERRPKHHVVCLWVDIAGLTFSAPPWLSAGQTQRSSLLQPRIRGRAARQENTISLSKELMEHMSCESKVDYYLTKGRMWDVVRLDWSISIRRSSARSDLKEAVESVWNSCCFLGISAKFEVHQDSLM